MTGVAQSHIHLRGRRGTISHPPSFRVAGWHSWHSVALGPDLVGPDARDAAALCVAGVAQLRHFTWQA